METRGPNLDSLNDWLGKQCRRVWTETQHPDWPELTVAELLQDELPKLMPCPKPFDGYVEYPARVSSTSLIHLERNRYSGQPQTECVVYRPERIAYAGRWPPLPDVPGQRWKTCLHSLYGRRPTRRPAWRLALRTSILLSLNLPCD